MFVIIIFLYIRSQCTKRRNNGSVHRYSIVYPSGSKPSVLRIRSAIVCSKQSLEFANVYTIEKMTVKLKKRLSKRKKKQNSPNSTVEMMERKNE